MTKPKFGFGIDLGGYGRYRGTAVVAAKRGNNRIDLTILDGTPFASTRRGNDQAALQIKKEAEFLLKLLKAGPVAVDVPIDLQGLVKPRDIEFIWEQTLRPIDRAYNALPPLASFLGYCVARFRVHKNLDAKTPYKFIETYPAATLKLLKLKTRKALQLCGSQSFNATPDETDAAICAITAVAADNEILQGAALLSSEVSSLIKVERSYAVPSNYRLIKTIHSPIFLTRSTLKDWCAASEPSPNV